MTQSLPNLLRWLSGCWDLAEAAFTRSDGTKIEPWGPEPAGMFIVTAKGQFSAHVMRRGREHFGSDEPTPEEKQRAFDDYLGYFGDAEALDAQAGLLTLRVGGALDPRWVGGAQERYIEVIDDDHIVLRTPPLAIRGVEVVGTLAWARRT
jgi:lipocalin-like protein